MDNRIGYNRDAILFRGGMYFLIQRHSRHEPEPENSDEQLLDTLLHDPSADREPRLRPIMLRSVALQREDTLAPYPRKTWLDTMLPYAERLLVLVAVLFWGYWFGTGWGRDLLHAWTSPPVQMQRPIVSAPLPTPLTVIQASEAPVEVAYPELGASLPIAEERWSRPAKPADYLVPARTYVAARPPVPTPAPTIAPSAPAPAAPPPDLRPVWIQAPSIGLDSGVVEVFLTDGSWQVADYAVGYHHGTGVAGSGNVVLAGHKGLRGAVFKDLEKLRRGDEIWVDAGGRRFQYRVTTTGTVWPHQVNIMYPTGSPVLTLITCTNWDMQRFVVVAELVESGSTQPAGGA